MTDGEQGDQGERAARKPGAAGGRSVTYCVIPAELAPKLHDLLRDHFSEDPRVEVVVEHRRRERRGTDDRRRAAKARGPESERRRIRGRAGRRIGERRAPLAPSEAPPELPRRARRYAERIAFVERLEPPTERDEDLDASRLVTRHQAGDPEAFATLYTRYFDRVYAYMRATLNQSDDAEDAAQQVFTQVFEALPRYEQRGRPFRAWLFTIVRNVAIGHLKKHGRVEVVAPEEIDRRRRDLVGADPAPIFDWIADQDLLLFVERLPLAQRQVLLLRYVFGFSGAETAEILRRTETDVRALQHRAVRFLEQRLTAIGRGPAGRDRARTKTPIRQARVLRNRRFALGSPR